MYCRTWPICTHLRSLQFWPHDGTVTIKPVSSSHMVNYTMGSLSLSLATSYGGLICCPACGRLPGAIQLLAASWVPQPSLCVGWFPSCFVGCRRLGFLPTGDVRTRHVPQPLSGPAPRTASSGSTQSRSRAYCTVRPVWFWSLISDLNQLYLLAFV